MQATCRDRAASGETRDVDLARIDLQLRLLLRDVAARLDERRVVRAVARRLRVETEVVAADVRRGRVRVHGIDDLPGTTTT